MDKEDRMSPLRIQARSMVRNLPLAQIEEGIFEACLPYPRDHGQGFAHKPIDTRIFDLLDIRYTVAATRTDGKVSRIVIDDPASLGVIADLNNPSPGLETYRHRGAGLKLYTEPPEEGHGIRLYDPGSRAGGRPRFRVTAEDGEPRIVRTDSKDGPRERS